jgi:methionyl aminopeptidase
MGFPKSCCTSVNEVVCHGIPDLRPLEDGDIVNVDIVNYFNGQHGDASKTYCVGENVDPESRQLIEVTEQSLLESIRCIGPGVNLTKVGDCIDAIATPYNYGIVRDFTGHGIGPQIHMLPHVFHFKNNHSFILEPGTCLTIEPMLTECKNAGVEYWDDGWTIVTKSKKRSAQFEHIILITEDGTEILT